jgi:hypothetical protein
VEHELREFVECMMKNVTISMDEGLLRRARVEAAKAGVSLSRFLSVLIQKELPRPEPPYTDEAWAARIAAVERFLSGPKLDISENGRMPNSDERNAP